MDPISLASSYFNWHYSKAFLDMSRVFLNLGWFFWKTFSIGELSMSLFVPFQRLDSPARAKTPQEIGSAFVVSILMRVLGAIIRLPIILLGIVLVSLVSLVALVAYPLWAILPALVPALIAAAPLVSLGLI